MLYNYPISSPGPKGAIVILFHNVVSSINSWK